MKVRVVKHKQLTARSIEDAFKFFSDPRVVEMLTPSKMRFRLVSAPSEPIKPGMILNFKFLYCHVPIRWRIKIESVDAPNSFVMVQEKGPFAHWRHSQTFLATGKQATEMMDRFEFALPFGRVGEFAYSTFIRAKIRELFDYRTTKMDVLMHRSAPRAARVQTNSRESQPDAVVKPNSG